MSFLVRSFHRALVPVCLLAALLAPLPLAAWPATAPFGETILNFVQNAYAGAGGSPSCQQVRWEYDTLKNLAAQYGTSSVQFEQEARHFVSTLLETENSYNYSTPFEQTPEFASHFLIPDPSLGHQHTQDYVIYLYHAFVQHDPDLNGLFYWTDRADDYQTLDQGKAQSRAVLDAFGLIPDDAEFTQLVHSLVIGLRNCCPTYCPPGSSYNCNLNECVSVSSCRSRFCPE